MGNILLVTTHFYPENFRCNELAFELAGRGWNVTVLAPVPDYPSGKFYDGYGVFRRRHEYVGGVEIIRTPMVPRGKRGWRWRLALNYASHTFFSCLEALRLAVSDRRFDMILVHETSPVMVAVPAVIYKLIRKVPLHFWVLDLWPHSLKAAGGIESRWILGVFDRLSEWIYRHSDTVLIGSRGFRSVIERSVGRDKRIIYYPYWVDAALENQDIAKIADMPMMPDGFNILVAGNIGESQDIPGLLKAAYLLKDTGVNILFAGDGRKRELLQEYIHSGKSSNVFYLGSFPLDSMPSLFAASDVLLMALKDEEVFSLTVPGRLQAYMASGRPVVAMINGEGADLIKMAGCGWSVPAGSPDQLAELLLRLSRTDRSVLEEAGAKGRDYSRTHFSFSKSVAVLEQLLVESTYDNK